MRLFAVIIIIFPVLLFYLIRNRKHDVFYPHNAYTLLYLVKIVLPTIIYAIPTNISIVDDIFLKNALYSDTSFFCYIILQSLGYVLVLLGIKVVANRYLKIADIQMSQNEIGRLDHENIRIYKTWGIIFYLLGILGFFLIMSKTGGVAYFFSNLQYRTYLVRDLDFESYLLSLLNYAPLLIIYSKRWTKGKIRFIDIILIIFAGLMVGLGGRKALLMLVVESIVIYHFVVKRIRIKKILRPKYIIGILFVYLFFTTYSKFRQEGAYMQFINSPVAFYTENVDGGLARAIAGESYVPFYVAIINYFETHQKWYGTSFKGLFTAFIPSSFYSDKPPVDDGMYLYSIANGRDGLLPPMPVHELDGSSWPLETVGAMYANFGSLGVLIGMWLVGIIIGSVYNKMIKTNYSFLFVIFYTLMLFTFELSSLRIVQLVMAFVILSVIQFTVNKLH